MGDSVIDNLANLSAVSADIHARLISPASAQFKRDLRGRVPSPQEILDFESRIAAKFGGHFIAPP